MKSLIAPFAILLAIITLNISQTSAQTIYVGGTISADSTWSVDTVKITSDLTIADNVTLTIDPGTYVEAQGFYAIFVEGTIVAEGDEGDTITFTVADTIGWSDLKSTAGGWSGIEFNNILGKMNDNDTSSFKYCNFSFGKCEDVFWRNSGAALYIRQYSKVKVEKCVFYHNYARGGGGAIFLYSNILIKDNLFKENSGQSGGSVKIYNGTPTFENNHFLKNMAEQSGGSIYIQGGGAFILNNEFESDSAFGSGGSICVSGQDTVVIRENHIHNCSSRQGAIYIQGNKVLIEKNDIHDNTALFDGAGVYLIGLGTIVADNDIYDNSCRAGAAIYSQVATAIIDNNRIYNNTSEEFVGAIMVNGGSTVIKNNDIHDNSCTSGAGAMRVGLGTHVLDNNKIYNNTADWGAGGIELSQASPIIRNCLITNNRGYEGGAISFENSNGVFQNNIIANNEALKGGAFSINGSSPLFINNTICNNKATDASSGGAAYIKFQSVPVFYNTIIHGNISDTDTNQFCFTYLNPVVDFFNCNIQGGTDGFIQPTGSVFLGQYENGLETLPLIAGPSSEAGLAGDGFNADWKIILKSPCVNSGTENIDGTSLPETDFFGNNRICYGFIDIGAHEYHDTVMEVIGKTYNEDVIWLADTVKITGDVNIGSPYTLTIHPGVYVEAQSFYTIEINGFLHANGTKSDSIIFTVKDTTGFSNASIRDGGWGGIYFSQPPATDSSWILYSRIEYFKSKSAFLNLHGAVHANDIPKLRIHGCTFRNNLSDYGAGICANGSSFILRESSFINNVTRNSLPSGGSTIYLLFSNATISNCLFDSNSGVANGTIFMDRSNPVISNCTFTNNFVAGHGGGIMMYYNSHPAIINNVFRDNIAEGNGGALCIDEYSAPDIVLNHISNNRGLNGGGIYSFRYGNTGSVVNNIISNNSAALKGGGIYLEDSNSPLISNTITNNRSGAEGGGVYLDRVSVSGFSTSIWNTIIWGNQDNGGLNQVHIYSGEGCRFYNSNIQGGLESFTKTFTGNWVEVYDNNIDSLPMFRNETPGTGADFTTLPEDWYIESNSPAIDAGTPDLSGLDIPETDMLGSARIHTGRIDIGAIENQDGAPVITMQPATLVKCEGDYALFRVQTNDSVFYQWQKDGMDIQGAASRWLILDSIQLNDEGNYSCVISNSYGSAFSYPAYLNIKEKPVIIQGPIDTWAKPNAPALLETYAQGTDLRYKWMKDSLIIPGATIPKLTLSYPTISNEGMYQCIVYNTCEADTTAPVPLYMVPQICLVTVDPVSGNNLVVWEKKSSAPLIAFIIYREGKAAGIYDAMDTIDYNALSVFVDLTADPTIQAYIYKITGIDTSGFETDLGLCNLHKTIHLLVSTNPETNSTQLEWDKYYGFEYQTYQIFRSETGSGFTPVHEIASSLSSWTDATAQGNVVFYRMAVLKPDPCYPAGGGLKADSGPYSHSMSNTEDNRLQEGGETNAAPTDVSLDNNTINENQSIGSLVGRLSSADADTNDHHIYKLIAGPGDDDNNRFTTLGDLLISADIFDYETEDTLHIRVKSTDKGDLAVEKEFTITINDVYEGLGNQAPTDITLDLNTIDENKMVGTLIGRLTTADSDLDDIHSYKLIDGLGGDNNGSFAILGDLLISADIFDYETVQSLTVRIRTYDNGDGRLSFEKSFTIYVNDILETTGLAGQDDQKLTVSPNPFSDKTIIRFNNPDQEKYRFSVTDLSGKVVRIMDNIYTGKIEFERMDLPPGCYIFELRGTGLFRGNLMIE